MSFKTLGLGCASGQVAGHYNTAAVSEAEHWHENLSSDSGSIAVNHHLNRSSAFSSVLVILDVSIPTVYTLR